MILGTRCDKYEKDIPNPILNYKQASELLAINGRLLTKAHIEFVVESKGETDKKKLEAIADKIYDKYGIPDYLKE